MWAFSFSKCAVCNNTQPLQAGQASSDRAGAGKGLLISMLDAQFDYDIVNYIEIIPVLPICYVIYNQITLYNIYW